MIAGIAYADFSRHLYFCFILSQLSIKQYPKHKKSKKNLKLNLMSLGFNGQNFQVPSRRLNRVATVQ